MTKPLRPCPNCGAFLQQAGWTELDVPVGERLEREHRRPAGAPANWRCPGARGKTHQDYRAEGMERASAMIPREAKAILDGLISSHGSTARAILVAAVLHFAELPPLERLALLQKAESKGDP